MRPPQRAGHKIWGAYLAASLRTWQEDTHADCTWQKEEGRGRLRAGARLPIPTHSPCQPASTAWARLTSTSPRRLNALAGSPGGVSLEWRRPCSPRPRQRAGATSLWLSPCLPWLGITSPADPSPPALPELPWGLLLDPEWRRRHSPFPFSIASIHSGCVPWSGHRSASPHPATVFPCLGSAW